MSGPSSVSADIFVAKLSSYIDLSEDELFLVKEFTKDTSTFDKEQDIIIENEANGHVYFLQSGWAIKYKIVSDGGRQIISFLIPGDIFGFSESLFDLADVSVQALTPVIVHPIPAEYIAEMCEEHQNLSLAFTWARAREQAILIEHIVRLGRRNAYERLGHILLELLHRLQLVDRAGANSFNMPLTQEVLADTLGLSIVHVNRTLQKLRKAGLIELDSETRLLRIIDQKALMEATGYDPGFLDQEGKPSTGILDAITTN